MAENMNEVIKQIALAAVDEAKPSAVLYGEVTGCEPLEITADQKLKLTKDFLVLTRAVSDHDAYMSVDHDTEPTSISFHHSHEAETAFGGDITTEITNEVEPDTTTVESSAKTTLSGNFNTVIKQAELAASHFHRYTGKKKYRVHNGLTLGEKVILIRFSGGQRFLVVDRVVF